MMKKKKKENNNGRRMRLVLGLDANLQYIGNSVFSSIRARPTHSSPQI